MKKIVVLNSTELKSNGKVLNVLLPGDVLVVKEVLADSVHVSCVATGWVRRADVGRPEEAFDMFSGQITRGAGQVSTYVGRAGALRCLCQFDEAVRDYDVALHLDPKNANAYARRGECWLLMGDRDKAWADFNKAAANNPEDPSVLRGRAVVFMQTGQLGAARHAIDKAIKLAPDYAEAYVSRGFIERNKREFDSAISDLNRAIKLRGNDPNLLMHRGDAWLESGNCDRAIYDYTAAYRISPGNVCLRHRAKAYRAGGKLGLAIDDLKAVVWTETSDVEALNELAWYQATSPNKADRDSSGAVINATKACELTDWKYACCLDTLAAAYAESGDFGHAVGFQKKALELADTNQKADFEARLQLYKARTPFHERPK